MSFTYSNDCFSDLYKDVYGFRPRGVSMDDWDTMGPTSKQAYWDELCAELEANTISEKQQAENAVAKFKARVQDVIGLGANDRKTALSWITGCETFYHSQDVEHFVWEQGILFTDYGKQLVKDLCEIVKYEEYV